MSDLGLRFVAALLLAVGMAACASSGVYTPYPFPTPGGRTGTTGSAPKTAPADPADPVAPPVAPPANPRRPIVSVPSGPSGTTDGYALSSIALSLRGAPYHNGGSDPGGFDCSGFVQYVFGQNGVKVPREVKDQYKLGKSVDRGKLAPGDLLFFQTVAPGASHVGIAIGGDQFVHAPSEKGVVRVEQLSAQYWASRFIGARRLD